MEIVVLDGHTLNPGDLSWEKIEGLADQFYCYPRTPSELVVERAKNADIILTNKVLLDKEILTMLPKLQYIAVTATGHNVVNIQAAQNAGVLVSNVPEYGTRGVAQHTFALILELSNHVGLHAESVRLGEWVNSPDFCYWKRPLKSLEGKSLGIIGYGRIGMQVGNIASAFGLHVVTLIRDSRRSYRESLFELLRTSDIVSLHCPLNRVTLGMIDTEALNHMKSSAFIINTARGELIVEKDLANCLNAGRIAGAALDVVSKEPILADNPLLQANNCLITPHNAWAAFESRQNLMDTVFENIESYLEGVPKNIVSI